MRNSIDTMETYYAGDPTAKLPIDIHLIRTQDFYQVCAEMSNDPKSLPDIPARAYYLQWHDRPIEVRRDFLFSMTPVGPMNPNVECTFNMAMRDVASENEYPELFGTLHSRMQHLLTETDDYSLPFSFAHRIATMRNRPALKRIRRMPWDTQLTNSSTTE